MLDKNLKQHCKEVQGKGKLMKGRKTFMFSTAQKEPPKNKGKSANEESIDSSCIFVQAEESENNANTLNIAPISKSGNSAKSSIVIASSTEFADGHGKKVDMKLSEISKFNPKLFDEINSHKQANELPKSEEHFNKLINQLNQCKTIADLCESFNYLSYISPEQSLVCNIYVMYPSQGGSQTPGRLNYNINLRLTGSLAFLGLCKLRFMRHPLFYHLAKHYWTTRYFCLLLLSKSFHFLTKSHSADYCQFLDCYLQMNLFFP